jgi:nicotinamide-nucleotide amidase
MKAEILSIGTELLLGQIVDTNAADLATFLADQGINCTHRQTVGDNLNRITEALQLALTRSDIVFTIGGLGPTPDDLTREAIAAALGEQLITDDQTVEFLQQEYGKRGLKMSESQFRQAQRPPSAAMIPNPNGTAPGIHATKNNQHIFALPGPKNEFNAMIHGPVQAGIKSLDRKAPLHSRTLRVIGISEAIIGEKLADLMQGDDVTLAPYAKTGEVHLRATTRADSKLLAEAKLQYVCEQLYDRLGQAIYAEGDQSLESWIIQSLTNSKQTISTAESCTGGLLAAKFTSVDGSSQVFQTGYVTYSATAKQNRLGVKEWTILQHGTVSDETAREMALGVRGRTGTHYGISITGVAGAEPLAERPEPKPSGLVFVGIASPKTIAVHRFHFRGDRATIRDRAVAAALIKLRNTIIGQEPTD